MSVIDDLPGVFDVDVVVKSSFIIFTPLESTHGFTETRKTLNNVYKEKAWSTHDYITVHGSIF